MEDFWRHAQLAARDRWKQVGSPAGAIDALAPPFNLSGFEPRMDPVPALGEHTRSLLQELGYARAEIETLAAEGVI
jgi:itaconate CoA-transferase